MFNFSVDRHYVWETRSSRQYAAIEDELYKTWIAARPNFHKVYCHTFIDFQIKTNHVMFQRCDCIHTIRDFKSPLTLTGSVFFWGKGRKEWWTKEEGGENSWCLVSKSNPWLFVDPITSPVYGIHSGYVGGRNAASVKTYLKGHVTGITKCKFIAIYFEDSLSPLLTNSVFIIQYSYT